MDGLELIRQIREKNKKQEIIVISVNTDSENLKNLSSSNLLDRLIAFREH